MIVSSSARPGKKLIQYLPDSMYSKPLEISRPSEGSVSGRPTPRNDSVASSAMACAICTVADHDQRRQAVGQHVAEHDARAAAAPGSCAASMYSLRRSTSAEPRTVRA